MCKTVKLLLSWKILYWHESGFLWHNRIIRFSTNSAINRNSVFLLKDLVFLQIISAFFIIVDYVVRFFLSKTLDTIEHCQNGGCVTLWYCYYQGRCSTEISEFIPRSQVVFGTTETFNWQQIRLSILFLFLAEHSCFSPNHLSLFYYSGFCGRTL